MATRRMLTSTPSRARMTYRKETTVLVDAVSGGLDRQANQRAVRQQPFGRSRCLMPEALGLEVHLGRVDLDEPHVLSVTELDRVAVDDSSDPVDRERRGSSARREEVRPRTSASASASATVLATTTSVPSSLTRAPPRMARTDFYKT
jgi:hypothetical protein